MSIALLVPASNLVQGIIAVVALMFYVGGFVLVSEVKDASYLIAGNDLMVIGTGLGGVDRDDRGDPNKSAHARRVVHSCDELAWQSLHFCTDSARHRWIGWG